MSPLSALAASTSSAVFNAASSLNCRLCAANARASRLRTRRLRQMVAGTRGLRISLHTKAPDTQQAPPVDEDKLRKYSERVPSYVSLPNLTQFGKVPLSEAALIRSAEAARAELPHRLARRVLAHRSLPFIVASNPFIAQVYRLYETSFATLSAVPPIRTLADNEAYTRTLEGLVEDHANNVPILARGFSECKDYLTEEQITGFFDRAIRNRIGIRLIAEQHLALSFMSHASAEPTASKKRSSSIVGIVDTQCSPAKIVKNCGYHVENLCDGAYGRAPDLRIDGDVDAVFAYVPSHIEYILNELLKNAFRATTEAHELTNGELPPVLATIAKSSTAPVISVRVRDAAGGIPPEVMTRVLDYAFTTVGPNSDSDGSRKAQPTSEDDAGPYNIQSSGGGAVYDELQGLSSTTGHLAGLGFGLPLSKLHAEYFGGSLELVSLYGHGTDAFVVFRGA